MRGSLTAWEIVKRIAHAVLWWLALAGAGGIVGAILTLGWSDSGNEAAMIAGFLVQAFLLTAVVIAWVFAIIRRWSLRWPLLVLFAVSWPFGFSLVGMIGLGKLIIHIVGRGETLAASDLQPTLLAGARPRGLVEGASYE